MTENQNLFGPGCPWYGMYEQFGPANIKWCEERLCTFFNEPANTWSNLGYIFVGIWIFYFSNLRKMRHGRLFGVATIIVGVTSFIFHATNNFLTQVGDFFGMFTYVYLLLVLNLHRLKIITEKQVYFWFWGLTFGSLALIPVLRALEIHYQLIVLVGAIGIVVTELQCRAKTKFDPSVSSWPFAACLVSFIVALGFSVADGKRIMCDPQNHWIQGHAIWHILGSLGIYFSFIYYRQFMEKRLG